MVLSTWRITLLPRAPSSSFFCHISHRLFSLPTGVTSTHLLILLENSSQRGIRSSTSGPRDLFPAPEVATRFPHEKTTRWTDVYCEAGRLQLSNFLEHAML